jgi:hypothetical protein
MITLLSHKKIQVSCEGFRVKPSLKSDHPYKPKRFVAICAVVQPPPSGTAEYNLEQRSENFLRRRFFVSGLSCSPRTLERWNPEVANIFGAAARYCWATAGSSHNDAHLDNSALH